MQTYTPENRRSDAIIIWALIIGGLSWFALNRSAAFDKSAIRCFDLLRSAGIEVRDSLHCADDFIIADRWGSFGAVGFIVAGALVLLAIVEYFKGR